MFRVLGMFIVLISALTLENYHLQVELNADEPQQPSASPIEIRKYVDRLSKLSDGEVQNNAEELVGKLLGELRFGGALEKAKNRRGSYQHLRKLIQVDLESSQSEYENLKGWLRQQKHRLDETYGNGSLELAQQRFQLLVTRQADRAIELDARINCLKSQVAQLDQRINAEFVREQLTSDELLSASRLQSPDKLLALPDEAPSLWVQSSGDADSSSSERPDPSKTAFVKRLLAEVQNPESK